MGPVSAHAHRLGLCLIAIATTMPVAGCNGDEGGDACLEALPRDCAIIWADYEAMHANLLGGTCGGGATGASCHAAAGAKGGLVLQDIDAGYASLLGDDGRPRVVPGDPECSELVKRIYSDDPALQMPPGQPLSDSERCSIVRWVADGAER